jgi:hypothetical protein
VYAKNFDIAFHLDPLFRCDGLTLEVTGASPAQRGERPVD